MQSAWRSRSAARKPTSTRYPTSMAAIRISADLTETLEKLYASEIVSTISSDATYAARYILTGGLDVAFVDYMHYAGDSRGYGST